MRSVVLVTGISLALIGAMPASASAKVLDDYYFQSTKLNMTIQSDPWRLRLFQPGKGNDLIESRSRSRASAGTLGFRTADGWFHATKIIRERYSRSVPSQYFVLATNDPAGREIAVRAGFGQSTASIRAHVLGDRGSVEAVGIAFNAHKGERYLGFGERSNEINQRGNVVENYVGEGPYRNELEYQVAGAVVPPWSVRERPDATYFPMPWLLSTRGYGFLLRNTETSYFRLGTDRKGAWSAEVDGASLDFRFFIGPTPAEVLERLVREVRPQPKPTAPWLLGPWFQTGQPSVVPPEDERSWAMSLREGDAPVSVAETHMRYLPCNSIKGNEQYERDRARWWHSQGFANLTYVQEKICKDNEPLYSQALGADALLKRPDGSVYEFDAFVGDRTPPRALMGQIDFSAPGAQKVYDSVMERMVSDGHDGWMEDFGESIPPDSLAANGMPGTRFHNLYPVLYHRAGWNFAKRQKKPIVRFLRSGWTGVHPYAQIVWGGDPTTDWGFDGLSSSITNGLTMGLSGVGIWGSDIGGYFTLPNAPQLTPELLIRWIQFGAVSGAMRTKGTGQAIPNYERPQIWEPEILPYWRRYAKLRTQLYPYLAAAVKTYRQSGMPMMRQLSLAYPRDRRASASEYEFLFGSDLLAAPVIEPGATTRTLYLPKGKWVSFWDAITYREKTGSYDLGRAELISGGRQITVPAPLEELPLFIRAGAALPMLPADIDTLAPFGKAKGLVHLKDRPVSRRLLLFPRGRSSRAIGYGGRVTTVQSKRALRVVLDTTRRESYALQISLGTLKGQVRPCGPQTSDLIDKKMNRLVLVGVSGKSERRIPLCPR